MHFAWCTPTWEGSQNDLTVYFGTDPNDPNEWIPLIDFNMMQSDGWTMADIELGNVYGTYYIIFFSHDNYGYCTALDDIEIYNYITMDDFVYTVNEDGTSVTLLGLNSAGSTDDILNIPSTITYNENVYTVTAIDINAFGNYSELTSSLVIPNTVTVIGDYAFYGCSGITGDLVIPDYAHYIGESAFADCSGFTGDLTIPNFVTTLGVCSFEGCSGFNGRLKIGNTLTKIPYKAFSGCSGFTELVIGSAVNYIDMQAFAECNGLTAIRVLPTTPPDLDPSAFMGFTNFSIPVTVPYGTVDLYMNAPGWNVFTNFVEAPYPMISEVYIEGFTPPVWGAHPDLDVTVPSGAPYSVYRTAWGHNGVGMSVYDWTVYDEEGTYFMGVILNPEDGYSFDNNVIVYFNGDASICNSADNEVMFGGRLKTFTIDFELWDPALFHSITTDVNPMEGGTVTGGGTFRDGDVCTLTAIPKSGYGFVGWSDGSTENPYSFFVTSDAQYVANFKSFSVGELAETRLNIYPNPATETIRIDGLETDSEVQIYNSLGMLVKTVNVVVDEEINVCDMEAGVYTIRCGKKLLRLVKI